MMPNDQPTSTYRISRISRNLGAMALHMILCMGGIFLVDPTGLAAMKKRPDAARVMAVLVPFGLLFSAGGVYLLAGYRRQCLVIGPSGITARGVFRTRSLLWDDVREVRWKIVPNRKVIRVTLRADECKISIDLSPMLYIRRDQIVQELRSRLDPARHGDWEEFATIAGLDDDGKPLRAPAVTPAASPIDEAEAEENRERWDRLFPWVLATGASAQVFILDAFPPPSKICALAFLPIFIIGFWPAIGSFPPSETLQGLRTLPADVRREVVACLGILAKSILVLVGVLGMIKVGLKSAMAGALFLRHRFAPGLHPAWVGLVPVALLLLGVILVEWLDRRSKRRADRLQKIARRKNALARRLGQKTGRSA
jgi:hypothetical protein